MIKSKKLSNALKKVKSGLLTALVLFGALGITAAENTEEVSAATLDSETAAKLISIGETYMYLPYDSSGTGGTGWPNKADCSTFVGNVGYMAGLRDDVIVNLKYNHLGGWGPWMEDLASQGIVEKKEFSSQEAAANEECGQGDIIVFWNSSGTSTDIAYGEAMHIGFMNGKNLMLSAIAGGVQYNTLTGTSNYGGYSSVSRDGTKLGVITAYTSGGYKIYDKIAIYHWNTEKDITVNVTKTSTLPNCTNDNALYPLSGAIFGVYTSSDCSDASKLGEITTDSQGKGSKTFTVNGNIDKVYTKELQAPANYELTETGYKVSDISGKGNQTVNVSFADVPVNDPANIIITKVDSEGKENIASLAGAVFTFKYYDVQVDSLEQLEGRSPKRTWVFKTVDKGNGRYGVDIRDANCFVSGNDLYTDNDGNVFIPVGSLTIQETNAVADYTVDGGYYTNQKSTITGSSEDTVFFKVTGPGSIETLLYGNEITKEEDSIRGGLSITKVDSETGRRAQGDSSFAGAEFDLYYIGGGASGNENIGMKIDTDGDGLGDGTEYMPSSETAVQHITLDSTGTFTSTSEWLGIGKYKLVETKAPAGMKAMADIEFMVTEDGVTVPLTATEDHFTGEATIHKTVNKSGSSGSSFTATSNEEGAVFDVVAAKYVKQYATDPENITREDVLNAYSHKDDWTGTDASGNAITGYLASEYAEITTGADGKATTNKLVYGTYYMVQVSGKAGYDVIEDVLQFSIEFDGDHKTFEAVNTETPYTLKIYKKDAKDGSLVTTNSAIYRIKKLTDIDGKDVSNKTDAKLGLKDGYIYQTLGDGSDGTKYMYFKTVSKGAADESLEDGMFYPVNDDGEIVSQEGSVAVPLSLYAGTYVLEEVGTPEGFATGVYSDSQSAYVGGKYQFTITSKEMAEINADGQYIVAVDMYDEQLTGTLKIKKSLDEYEGADVTLVSHDLSKFGFTLYAAKNIVDPATGAVIAQAGEEAKYLSDTDAALSGGTSEYIAYGEKFCDADGNLEFTNLPLGEYVLKETTHPDGTVENTAEYSVIVEQTAYDKTVDAENVEKDDVKVTVNDEVVYENGVAVAFGIENYVTKTSISKKSVTGQDELEGATLTIKDSDGNVVKDINGEDLTWVSGKKEHKIEGLTVGKTYTLVEEITAEDYVKASDVEFTINEDGSVTPVTMIDKMVTVSKVDMGGNEVEGAKMSVTDSDGSLIDEWTSDGTEHKVKGLEEGKTYVLHEVVAPEGYAKATDIEFTVTGEEDGVKVDQHIDMTDKIVTVSKTDITGEEEVEGATLKITDEDGIEIETWVSGKEPHKVSGLEVGKTYTLHEENAPDGYYYATDITFTVTDDGIDQTVEMVDEVIRYSIKKVDNNGDPVEGVTLKLTDVTDPENTFEVELPNGGVTTKEAFDMTGKLIAGHKYVLEETAIIDGVFKADNIEFTVEKYAVGEETTITMVDDLTSIAVKKVSPSGETLAGAKMQIIKAVKLEDETSFDESVVDDTVIADETAADKSEEAIDPEFSVEAESEDEVAVQAEEATPVEEATKADEELDPIYTNTDTYVPALDENGKEIVVYEFTSTDDEKGTDISKYVQGGETYILREVESPFGFKKFEDKVFTVSGKENSYQLIQMVDARETYYITATKVDADDTSKTLEGAEITLFTSAGKVAVDVNGQACVGTTGKDGKVTWNVAYNGDLGGYYVMETKSPKGYKLNKDKFEVTLSADYDFAENNPIKIVIKDEINKKTGVGAVAIGAGVALMGATGGLVAMNKKKKKEDSEDNSAE